MILTNIVLYCCYDKMREQYSTPLSHLAYINTRHTYLTYYLTIKTSIIQNLNARPTPRYDNMYNF